MPNDFSLEGVGDMLDGLKSRLGFSHDGNRRGGDYDDRYDDPDDYGDYGYDAYGDEESATDPQVGGYRPAAGSVSSGRASRFGRPDSSPNLVSFDDVKTSTSVPDRLYRDPLPPRGGNFSATTNVGGHTVIDTTVPAPQSPAYKAALRDGGMRPDGANTRYETALPAAQSLTGGQATGSFDPYEAYSSSTPSRYVQARTMTVVRPVSYGDVEQVARAVKSGDVVVLAMRNTSDDLSKRILDFSFGVASALDANVECPGDKVFAIARGSALTEDEKRKLRAQAIL